MILEELCRMAARGEEDGHDHEWFVRVVRDKRAIDRMLRAAGAAKAALKEHEEECYARLTRRAGVGP
jgi:hypothetical protein